jgi:hypothetical protein
VYTRAILKCSVPPVERRMIKLELFELRIVVFSSGPLKSEAYNSTRGQQTDVFSEF